jgi:hypothetical protein
VPVEEASPPPQAVAQANISSVTIFAAVIAGTVRRAHARRQAGGPSRRAGEFVPGAWPRGDKARG